MLRGLNFGQEEPKIEFIRVEYDIARATQGIRESDLPDEFAVFLETGGASLDP